MSDFNKILAFQSIMPYLSEAKREELAQIMGMSLTEIKKRLSGKNKEDEFILILIFMNVVKSIAAFDEGVSQIVSTATSDLLIELKSGKKFMLEIKHTDKEPYKISSGNLNRRIEYAKSYNLDLYFAISIMGYWMLFNAEYVREKSGKIAVSDMLKSELDTMLGCVSYVFAPGLMMKSTYSHNANKPIGINHEQYGQMVSFELYYKGKKLFRVKGKKSPYIGWQIVLSALQDRMSVEKQEIVESGEFTIITEELAQDYNAISEYKFLLAPVEHTINDDGERYTAHSYLENQKVEKQNSRIELNYIRGIIQWLVNEGVDVKYIRNNTIYQINPQE